jgi:hypothetical protein
MTDLRAAAQQALEALEGVLDDSPKVLDASISGGLYEVVQCRDAITALREALAQPAQEPVAWAVQACSKMWRGEFAEIDAKAEAKRIGGTCVAYPLYTAAAQRPWVGLEAEEILDLFDKTNVYGSKWVEFARTVEAALRSKNK